MVDKSASERETGTRGDADQESRRRFLKGAAAVAGLVAVGALAGGAAKKGLEAAAEAGRDAGLQEQRRKFLAQARAAIQGAHPMAASAAEALPETTIAALADPGGNRSAKLQSTLPAPSTAGNVSAAEPPVVDENILLRMQRDLERALQKPVEQRRWAMVIDLRKCIGCSACTVACKAENKLPPGVVYRPVIEQEVGEFPYVTRRFIPRPCMQCEHPPCVPVCPVGATYQRPDGVVKIDYNACIGCRYCITACPYGARYFDFGDGYTDTTPEEQPYEKEPSLEYGRSWVRARGRSPEGNVRKCQFCLHRIAAGMLPACTTTCVGAATFFGDANDRESLVAELIDRPNVMRLKEHLGTEPKVYYLV